MDFYFNECGKMDVLSKNESLELAIEAKKGNSKARDKFISSNLRFVILLAKQYKKRFPFASLEDLIASGNIGLVKAADKFEPSMNNSFTTYAQFWIRDEICKELNLSHDIVIPKSSVKKVGKSMQTIASSIDDELFCESDVASEFIVNVEDEVEKRMTLMYLDQALSNLTDKEENILRLHYGIGCEKKSLDQIGKLYGNANKETVRLWELKALNKLRTGKNAALLN